MLQMPAPLDKRLFYTQQAIDDHNAAVAAYLAQQHQAEYKHTKNQKRNKRFDKNEY